MTSIRWRRLLSALLVGAGLGLAGVVAATEGVNAASEHKFELAKRYYGECTATDSEEFEAIRPQLKAFTDMEVMAATMADPAAFARLMAVVNDPRTIHVMTKCATEPVMWDTWMRGMTDFNKMGRAMAHFMNPNMFMQWMMAPMNPAMYQPAMQMMNPVYYTRWMNAMTNPAFYSPVTSLVDPNWYGPRIAWMSNPQSLQPMFNMLPPVAGYLPGAPAAAAQAQPAPAQ